MPDAPVGAPEGQRRAAERSFRSASPAPHARERMIALAFSALVSAALLALVAHKPGLAPTDRPNARSLHERPVPRAGGWAVWAGFFAVAPWMPPPPGFAGGAYVVLLAAIVVLFAVSLVD